MRGPIASRCIRRRALVTWRSKLLTASPRFDHVEAACVEVVSCPQPVEYLVVFLAGLDGFPASATDHWLVINDCLSHARFSSCILSITRPRLPILGLYRVVVLGTSKLLLWHRGHRDGYSCLDSQVYGPDRSMHRRHWCVYVTITTRPGFLTCVPNGTGRCRIWGHSGVMCLHASGLYHSGICMVPPGSPNVQPR